MLVNLPVKRGFDSEVLELYDTIKTFDGFIAGGYARFCLSPLDQPAPTADIDVYPLKPNNFDCLQEVLTAKYRKVNESDCTITFETPSQLIVQLIKPFRCGDSIEEVIKGFDLTICTAAILTPESGITHAEFATDELNHQLNFTFIDSPLVALFRAIKYIKRGYELKPSQAIRIFEVWRDEGPVYRKNIWSNINEIDQLDPKQLESGMYQILVQHKEFEKNAVEIDLPF